MNNQAPPSTLRKRKNFRIPADLSEWVENYAAANKTTMTQLIIDYFKELRIRNGGQTP